MEDCGDGSLTKYRRVVKQSVNVISSNKKFLKNQHSVATYGQTKKGLFSSFPGKSAEENGIDRNPLQRWIFIVLPCIF